MQRHLEKQNISLMCLVIGVPSCREEIGKLYLPVRLYWYWKQFWLRIQGFTCESSGQGLVLTEDLSTCRVRVCTTFGSHTCRQNGWTVQETLVNHTDTDCWGRHMQSHGYTEYKITMLTARWGDFSKPPIPYANVRLPIIQDLRAHILTWVWANEGLFSVVLVHHKPCKYLFLPALQPYFCSPFWLQT